MKTLTVAAKIGALVVKVDDDLPDEWLNRKWFFDKSALGGQGGFYCFTESGSAYLHRVVLALPTGKKFTISLKDGDHLNHTRENFDVKDFDLRSVPRKPPTPKPVLDKIAKVPEGKDLTWQSIFRDWQIDENQGKAVFHEVLEIPADVFDTLNWREVVAMDIDGFCTAIRHASVKARMGGSDKIRPYALGLAKKVL